MDPSLFTDRCEIRYELLPPSFPWRHHTPSLTPHYKIHPLSTLTHMPHTILSHQPINSIGVGENCH